MLEFLGADLGNLDTVTDCYGSFVTIYSINYALVFMRPVMGKKLGSKKSETDVGQVGCPWTAHCWVLGLLKSVPGCVNWIRIVHVLCA